MKRIIKLMLMIIFIVSATFSCPVIASAEENINEEYYRACANSSVDISQDQIEDIDNYCKDLANKYECDLAIAAVTPEDLNDMTVDEFAAAFYEFCDFGYGPDKDGALVIYEMDNRSITLHCFGNAAERFTSSFYEKKDRSAEFMEEYGVYGVMYSIFRDVEEAYAAFDEEAQGVFVERYGENASMPPWYPVSIDDFKFYHDESASRVVDYAEILSDEAEERIKKRIAEISSETGKDIVVVTDNSTYGLGEDIYAADFYDFNGYGYGEEREGLCLTICMDPEDRGGWVCATGSETMALYTEKNANLLDDELYYLLGNGEYDRAVEEWIENVSNLYTFGVPIVPDWYPKDGVKEGIRNADSPRVIDESGQLSTEQTALLTAKAKELSDKYGTDIAIHMTDRFTSFKEEEYAKLVYDVYGYGVNNAGDCLMLLVKTSYSEDRELDATVWAFGAEDEKLKSNNKGRMELRADWESDLFEACEGWLKDVAHMKKTGRVMRTWVYWVLMSLAAIVLGLLFGKIRLGIAESKIAKPRVAKTASEYVKYSTMNSKKLYDTFLYSTVQRTRRKTESRSSSNSGSGRSTYKSSYSGSSGASHSGSGRKF